MTGPEAMWQTARPVSAMGLARLVSTSANRKSAHVTSLQGVPTRNTVCVKNNLVSCRGPSLLQSGT